MSESKVIGFAPRWAKEQSAKYRDKDNSARTDEGMSQRTADLEDRRDEWGSNEDGAAEAQRQKARNAKTPEEKLDPAETRDALIYDGNQLEKTVEACEGILVKRGAEIYQRANRLVRLVVSPMKGVTEGVTLHVANLVECTHPFLLGEFTRFVDWRTQGGNKTSPNNRVASAMLSRSGRWPFAQVSGVISTPTLRPDGTLLSQEGYDPATQLILVKPPPMPRIGTHRIDAEAAIKLLDGLLDEFPFVSPEARSAALSGLITPVVRAALVAAPMHATTAPVPGSGKTLYESVVAAISLGEREMIPMPAGSDSVELEKRLNGMLMAGFSVMSIDNAAIPLGGDALCQAITAQRYIPRILRTSDVKPLLNTWCLYANGNNLVIVDDLTRRTLMIELDAKLERPEERTFRQNPVKMVLADRGRYIAAALCVALAYIEARKPGLAARVGETFEGWSDLVRSPLIWLGYPDPYATTQRGRANDPELEVRQQVFEAMRNVFGTESANARTCAEMVAAAKTGMIKPAGTPVASGLDLLVAPAQGDPRARRLYDALLAAVGNPREVNSAKVGYWFRANKGKIVGGLQLRSEKDRVSTGRWWVQP